VCGQTMSKQSGWVSVGKSLPVDDVCRYTMSKQPGWISVGRSLPKDDVCRYTTRMSKQSGPCRPPRPGCPRPAPACPQVCTGRTAPGRRPQPAPTTGHKCVSRVLREREERCFRVYDEAPGFRLGPRACSLVCMSGTHSSLAWSVHPQRVTHCPAGLVPLTQNCIAFWGGGGCSI